ncbi:hypothetical protein QUF95_08885 [Paenibacillus silvae]|uniref:hypothetical protein n=1 Tax=Paenibacillus silvae TaxID=1325358 RepID=UPI0025A016BA|nr:hypothetical protein [Paenibacillus silvae]MDM5277496.1 hypothetical protein [Paenibacillus silvae]
MVLPNFENSSSVIITSDYGGEASNSKYLTYTFTFDDYELLNGIYKKEILKIREKYGLNEPYKEISFKDVRYGPIQRALKEYLHVMNWGLNGLVFTLVISKEVLSMFGENNKNTLKELSKILEQNTLGKWAPKNAEKVQRIVATMGYLTHLLIPDGKKIFWMTDEDSIMANEKMATATINIFSNVLNSFEKKREYSTIVCAKPFEKGTDPVFLDILSLSDLVAGSLEHYYTNGNVDSNEGAKVVLGWLANHGVMLKKQTLLIELKDEHYRYGFVDFSSPEPLENVKYINISL